MPTYIPALVITLEASIHTSHLPQETETVNCEQLKWPGKTWKTFNICTHLGYCPR